MSAAGEIEVRQLLRGEASKLDRTAPGVFDRPVVRALAEEFLADRRHHLVVALDGDLVVGMASAIDYVHPDKPAELWIDEVGVAPSHRGRGLGRRLLEALLEAGRSAGCRQAWVVTERANRAAMALYRAMGGVESGERPVLLEFPLGGTDAAAD